MNSPNNLRRDDVTASIPRPHRAQMPEEIHGRNPGKVETNDIEKVPLKYVALAMLHLRNQMANLAKMAEDNSRPVDEYNKQTLAPESETILTIQPDWEVTEVIKSVMITGPTGAVVVQLGDRTWNITIPASGFVVIAPVAFFLSRSDVRQLTASTAGEYTLELMGHCDNRAG